MTDCLGGICSFLCGKKERLVTNVIRQQLRAGIRESNHGLTSLLLQKDPARPITDFYTERSEWITLGQGGFGSVFKVTHRATGDARVVKAVRKEAVSPEFLHGEFSTLLKLDHPNVLKIYDYFEDTMQIYFVTELCSGGEFLDAEHQDRLSELDELRRALRQVVQAIAYCHSQGVVHRDLKFENLMFKDSSPASLVKVIDFGLAATKNSSAVDGPWLTTRLGTVPFVAPEVIDENVKYDEKCDMWSFGIILYILLTDEHPFWSPSCQNPKDLFRNVRSKPFARAPLDQAAVDPAARRLIGKLLEKDSRLRPSAEAVLKDTWMLAEGPSHRSLSSSPMMGQSLKSLHSYAKASHFERAVMMIAAHSARDEEVKQFRKIFMRLDTDATGTLSKAEIGEGFRECGICLDESLFDALDADGDGRVSYTEFLAASMESSHFTSERAVTSAFKFFDLDGDGKISFKELLQVLGPQEAQVALNGTDTAKDGTISLQEFTAKMKDLADIRGLPKVLYQRHSSSSMESLYGS